jgi:hypothetical protein
MPTPASLDSSFFLSTPPASPLSLPENPSLEALRKRAKALQRALGSGDPAALAWQRQWHPRPEKVAADPLLSEAQLVLARVYGFASWARLKRHLEAVTAHGWDPEVVSQEATSPVDGLLRQVCLAYDHRWQPSDLDAARELLRADAPLARADVYVAAALGDVEAVRHFLVGDPGLARRKGGTFGWEPLLYACYSRWRGQDAVEVARLLLAAGADANAGFLWRGNVPPFTALTGAFGGGEGNHREPPHPDRDGLVRLLLAAGADPNDGQTLYNLHFRPDDAHLRILLGHGLGRDQRGPWYGLLGDRLHSPRQLLVEELWSAARRNFSERVRLLVGAGADVNGKGVRDGRTPYQAAVRAGNLDIAAYLVEHGAERHELGRDEAFAAACIAGRRDEALGHIAAEPGLVDRIGHHRRVELLHRAVESRSAAGIRLMAELGFEISGITRHDNVGIALNATPLHNAAWFGQLDLIRLLFELGADPTLRDPTYQATPRDWAAYNQQNEAVALLDELAPSGERSS